jgi:hypothetical protein
MLSKLTAAIIGSVCCLGVVTAQEATATKPGAAAADKPSSCTCAVVPWTPAACVKQCSTQFIARLPADQLASSLALAPSVKKGVVSLKASGVTQGSVNKFLGSPEGLMFLKSVEKAPENELKVLASESSTSKSSKEAATKTKS